jgi:hypothetical protein
VAAVATAKQQQQQQQQQNVALQTAVIPRSNLATTT